MGAQPAVRCPSCSLISPSLDALMDFGQEAKSEYFKQVNKRLRAFPLHVDRDLVAPFRDAVEEAFRNKGSPYWASRLSDLQKIYDQVAVRSFSVLCERTLTLRTLADDVAVSPADQETWQRRVQRESRSASAEEAASQTLEVHVDPHIGSHVAHERRPRERFRNDGTPASPRAPTPLLASSELTPLAQASCAYAYPLQKPPLGISTTKRFFSGGDGNFTEVGTTLAWGWAWDVAHREICAIKSGALTARQHSTFIGATAAMGMSAPSVHYPMVRRFSPPARSAADCEARSISACRSIEGLSISVESRSSRRVGSDLSRDRRKGGVQRRRLERAERHRCFCQFILLGRCERDEE